MTVKRTNNRLEIDCSSELETIKVFSAVLAAGIVSAESFGVSPQGMLSTLDDVESMLKQSEMVILAGKNTNTTEHHPKINPLQNLVQRVKAQS